MMFNVPKMMEKLTPHNVLYCEFVENDDYDKPIYKSAIEIKKVKFDDSLSSSSNLTEISKQFNAVCFIYTGVSENVPKEFVTRSKVVFNAKEYVITNVVPVSHPFKDSIWAYELEVI